MTDEQKKLIVLAFDTECTGQKLGPNGVGEVIALGVSVVDEDGHELDGFTFGCYRERETNNHEQFEKRCWDEFWMYSKDKLKEFEFDKNVTVVEQAKRMTLKFQEFRAKWETYAREHNMEYVIVGDNNVYDGEKMNQLIYRFTDDTGLPYSASKYCSPFPRVDNETAMQHYECFDQTDSMKRGFLMAYNMNRRFPVNRFEDLADEYEFLPRERVYDHSPQNDAYCIARDRQLLNVLSKGKLKRKRELFEEESANEPNKK